MKHFRNVIFWLHLGLGVSAALIVVIMSATGVLLTYQRQIQAWADTRALDGTPPSADAVRLPVAELVERASNAREAEPTAVRFRADDSAPVEVVFGRDGTVFVNGYTGAVLGTGSERTRAFFRSVTDWHRWLARSGDSRATGRAITGAANFAFLFIVMSGFYLWWPRNFTRKAFGNVLVFRRGLRAKARDFNWHNVVGFWSLVPLFFVVLSGVVISYPWAGELVYRAVGDSPPPRTSTPARATASAPAAPARATARDIAATARAAAPAPVTASMPAADALLARAMDSDPEWNIITMQLEPKDGGVSFSVDRGDGGQPQKRTTLVLAADGSVLSREPFSELSAGRRARSILRFAHTGEVGGMTGQTLAGAVSLGALVLVWTGIALTLRRLVAFVRRRRSPAHDLYRAKRLTPEEDTAILQG